MVEVIEHDSLSRGLERGQVMLLLHHLFGVPLLTARKATHQVQGEVSTMGGGLRQGGPPRRGQEAPARPSRPWGNPAELKTHHAGATGAAV